MREAVSRNEASLENPRSAVNRIRSEEGRIRWFVAVRALSSSSLYSSFVSFHVLFRFRLSRTASRCALLWISMEFLEDLNRRGKGCHVGEGLHRRVVSIRCLSKSGSGLGGERLGVGLVSFCLRRDLLFVQRNSSLIR